MKKALLVIDMLRDFIEPTGALYCGKQGETIVSFIKEKIEEFLAENAEVLYICDKHSEDDLEFKRFPKHCINGTKGAEIIPALAFASTANNIIEKKRYGAFFQTDLAERLADVEEVTLVGVCTNICVLYTAEELCNRDKKVIVYRNGIASFDQNAHEFALQQMESVLGIEAR